MRRSEIALCGAVLAAVSMAAGPAYATAAIETVAAAGSYKVALAAVGGGAGVATVAVKKKSVVGTVGGILLGFGGLALGVVDPPGGTFYDGSLTVTYPSNLLKISASGWLGSWGNLGSPALPVNPDDWGNQFDVTLQDPNSDLSAIVDNGVPGQEQVSFTWTNPGGHAMPDPGPFNFFANVFTATANLHLSYLGTFASPPAGANFYVSSFQSSCTPPGNVSVPPLVTSCGETGTQYYSVTVPEPPAWSIMLLGLTALGAIRLYRRRSPRVQKGSCV